MAHHLGIDGPYLEDPLWADKIEFLPNDWMIMVEDVAKAFRGEPFRYFTGEGTPAVYSKGCPRNVFDRYYEFYDNFVELGLPDGKGWRHLLPFSLKLLKHFKKLSRIIESWQMKKNTR